ncbi:MAG: flagellar biosynthetic protein FliR [Actinobacteria bacterium]|nr:flagellar biosynthetic protein FliR [Actinomycetota bacterium]MBV8561988.1 flagellar biosynthetic protein FliR [Actinomycetota bacterium]
MTLQLPQIAGAQLLSFVLVASRIGGMFAFAPIFSSPVIPARVRSVILLALALAISPVASAHAHLPTGAAAIAAAVVKEVLVGLVLAFGVGVLMAAVNAGAALLDAMVGFSFAQIVDPFTQVQAAAFGQLYAMFATLVLLLTGGDQLIIEGFASSYRIIPIDAYPHLSTLTGMAVHGFANLFVIALEIVAPVVIALLVTDAGLGLIARAAPQMNVFMVGLPAKILVAFGMVMASLPFVANQLQTGIQNTLFDSLRLLRG